jgi:hypothetical protein
MPTATGPTREPCESRLRQPSRRYRNPDAAPRPVTSGRVRSGLGVTKRERHKREGVTRRTGKMALLYPSPSGRAQGEGPASSWGECPDFGLRLRKRPAASRCSRFGIGLPFGASNRDPLTAA